MEIVCYLSQLFRTCIHEKDLKYIETWAQSYSIHVFTVVIFKPELRHTRESKEISQRWWATRVERAWCDVEQRVERAWCDVENVTPRSLNARCSSTLRDFLGFACVLQAQSVRSTQMWRSSGLKMTTVKSSIKVISLNCKFYGLSQRVLIVI